VSGDGYKDYLPVLCGEYLPFLSICVTHPAGAGKADAGIRDGVDTAASYRYQELSEGSGDSFDGFVLHQLCRHFRYEPTVRNDREYEVDCLDGNSVFCFICLFCKKNDGGVWKRIPPAVTSDHWL